MLLRFFIVISVFVPSMSLNFLFSGGYFGFYAPQALTAQQLTAAGNYRHASGQISASVTSLHRAHCSSWAAGCLRLAPNSRHHAHRGGPAPGSRDQDPVEKSGEKIRISEYLLHGAHIYICYQSLIFTSNRKSTLKVYLQIFDKPVLA